MPTLIRTITYTGPQEWLDSCIDRAFVALEQELGHGKKITSKWRDTKAQARAQRNSDKFRRLRDKAQQYVRDQQRRFMGDDTAENVREDQ